MRHSGEPAAHDPGRSLDVLIGAREQRLYADHGELVEHDRIVGQGV
ncbi:MAG: hypothetical protein OEN50_13010 [Deltaproteobacteria bacterium]|nr:hypothetical protein [Deltaproteobacteria bacterium]